MTLNAVARLTVTEEPASVLSQFQRLFVSRHVERIDANEELYDEAEPSWAFEIVSGCVRHSTLRPNGRRSIVSFSFEGDYCGYLFGGTSGLVAEAVAPSTVRRIPVTQFRTALAQQPGLEVELLHLARRELDSARAHLLLLGSSSAVLRVASFLLSCAERLPSQDAGKYAVNLPMRRLDIADFLGLTIESVSRALTQLKRLRCISIRGANDVIFENVSMLRQLAHEETPDELGLGSRNARSRLRPPSSRNVPQLRLLG